MTVDKVKVTVFAYMSFKQCFFLFRTAEWTFHSKYYEVDNKIFLECYTIYKYFIHCTNRNTVNNKGVKNTLQLTTHFTIIDFVNKHTYI